jgi:prepilin-type N-terminal cleavage/methylation domain-containing protein
MTRPTTTPAAVSRRRRTVPARMRGGFTLVELLVVIIVLAILAALLLPAVNSAVKTARITSVSAEVNNIAQALAAFKSKYGDYPPSRIILAEDGDYSALIGNNSAVSTIDPTAPPSGDITVTQLATRSMAAMRKFFPRVNLSTQGPVFPSNSTVWYDFNGDGVLGTTLSNGTVSKYYVLHGHECLVFFLGGIPLLDASSASYGMVGFGKDPTNPFTNPSWAIGGNRNTPMYEFNGSRLFLDPSSISASAGGSPGIPGYYDSFGNSQPGNGLTINFYAYFSAYGNSAYDPNDVNFPTEQDANLNTHVGLHFANAASFTPNPYTVTQSVTQSGIVTYQSPQSFQIISSGIDGLYGVGGQYLQTLTSSSTDPLPFDARVISNIPVTFYGIPPGITGETDNHLRTREADNVTNFKSGKLQ